jgi:hypothetical protein
MPGRPDCSATLSRWSPLTHPRLRYVADADETTIASIDCGVFVFLAFWSGGACLSYRRLMETLQAPRAQEIDVVIADHDGTEALWHHPDFVTQTDAGVFSRLHGYGETFWIRAGRIVAFTSGKDGYKSIPECLDRLLSS